jgi:hypothetical protein
MQPNRWPFFLSSDSTDPTKPPDTPPPNNGVIHTLSNIMRVVLFSATKSEAAALFFNGKDGVMLCTTLEEMGHPQPATPIQTNNSCASGIANKTI